MESNRMLEIVKRLPEVIHCEEMASNKARRPNYERVFCSPSSQSWIFAYIAAQNLKSTRRRNARERLGNHIERWFLDVGRFGQVNNPASWEHSRSPATWYNCRLRGL